MGIEVRSEERRPVTTTDSFVRPHTSRFFLLTLRGWMRREAKRREENETYDVDEKEQLALLDGERERNVKATFFFQVVSLLFDRSDGKRRFGKRRAG